MKAVVEVGARADGPSPSLPAQARGPFFEDRPPPRASPSLVISTLRLGTLRRNSSSRHSDGPFHEERPALLSRVKQPKTGLSITVVSLQRRLLSAPLSCYGKPLSRPPSDKEARPRAVSSASATTGMEDCAASSRSVWKEMLRRAFQIARQSWALSKDASARDTHRGASKFGPGKWLYGPVSVHLKTCWCMGVGDDLTLRSKVWSLVERCNQRRSRANSLGRVVFISYRLLFTYLSCMKDEAKGLVTMVPYGAMQDVTNKSRIDQKKVDGWSLP